MFASTSRLGITRRAGSAISWTTAVVVVDDEDVEEEEVEEVGGARVVDVPTGSEAPTGATRVDDVEVPRLVPTAGLSAAPRTAMATIMATVRIATPTRIQKNRRRLKRLDDVRPWTAPGSGSRKPPENGPDSGNDSPGASPSTL
jgi:hypothetical protein